MEPYLSIVVTTRNDDHGGSLLRRTQTFVNALIGQCKRHQLAAELIVVEWNPPPDRPPLHEALHWPADTSPCQVRFIEVPESAHTRFSHADALPLLQMIGKNVGIRRARGRFVLATNIDIIFSDELMSFLAAKKPDAKYMYRIDRHDVMADVPANATVEEQLAYCVRHHLRVNARGGTYSLNSAGGVLRQQDDIVSADSGIALGQGWYGLEWESGTPFRWAGPDAELAIAGGERSGPLLLEVEPGPGVGSGPFVLTARDEKGSPVAEVTVNDRSLVALDVGPSRSPRTLRMDSAAGGNPTPEDLRIINFRVFRCAWDKKFSPPTLVVPLPPAIGVLRKILGVIRRAAENGPVITVWVPVPHMVRRFLRLFFRTRAEEPREPQEPQERQEPRPVYEVGPHVRYLHTNACGDFTLMAREHWFALRAYPEWDLYSFHIDSVFCYAAHHGGVREYLLEQPMKIYHIEHGSGWTPEGAGQLFQRLREKGIPWLEYKDLASLAFLMRRLDCPMIFNGENWGLSEIELRETVLPLRSGHRKSSG
jgi:hypothetical protein